MLFKLLVPFTLAVVIAQRTTTPVFDFPDVILRADIPAGITVHEGDASAAALEALAAPKLESRGLLERDSNCKGANPSCKWYVATRDCIQAYEVRYGKDTHKHRHRFLTGNLFLSVEGVFYVNWLNSVLVM